MKIDSGLEDLDIYVEDNGISRNVRIKGTHVAPGGSYHCQYSEFETQLSLETLTKIGARKGRYFRDEIERSENPNYMKRKLQILLKEFEISLSQKRILDFGCGSGASTLNFLRCGATDVTGVEVDESLLDIAVSRLNDFFQEGYELIKIGYLDGEYCMPFSDGEFDIAWAHAVMEHIHPNQRRFVLKEIWRLLKTGGLLIINATPNRLWIQEYHTSNLFFVNYLPFNIASFIARHCSSRIPFDQSKEALLSNGFRGCTYWDIAKALPNSVCLNNIFRKKDLSTGIQSWRGDTHSRMRKSIINIYGFLMELADPLLAIFGIPQTAFLPSHIILFRKL